jgi:hypothetical protein
LVGRNLENILTKAREIIQTVQALKRGERVLLLWHDACRVSNDPVVRPQYYSTPKESQGTVFDCLPDPEFSHVFYLIVWGEMTGKRPDYYDAIPVSWIARIQTLEPTPVKFPKRITKIVPAGRRSVERVMVYKGGQLVADSGGISKVPLRFEPKGKLVKLVEEISKVVA